MEYVKLISERQLEFAPVNKDNIVNYNCEANEEMLFRDGYKRFIRIERPETDRYYEIQYQETSSTDISEVVVWTETIEEYNTRKLVEAKQAKKEENDTKRSSIWAIKAYFSDSQSGYLLRSTPVGDIMTVVMGIALPSMMAQQPIAEGTFRYYDGDRVQHPSPQIEAAYVPTFYQRFASAIAGIDAYSADIDKQIDEATTIAEVNAIIIDYTVVGVF